MIEFVVGSLLTLAASTKDLPNADDYRPRRPYYRVQEREEYTSPLPRRVKRPTRWKVRIEGENGFLLIPIPVAQEWGLRPGVTISVETARLIAEDMGADYPPDIIEKLEKLK